MANPNRIGEMLVKAGKITQQQLEEALVLQQSEGGRLGTHLVKGGFLPDDELVEFLSQRYGVPAINLAEIEIDEGIIKIIPPDVARKYTILPVSKAGAKLTIAMVDPTNVFAMDDIKFMTGYNVEPVVASEMAIREAIESYYGSAHSLELKKVMDQMAEEEAEALEVLEEVLHLRLPLRVDRFVLHAADGGLEVGRFHVADEQAVTAQEERVVVPAMT